MECPRSIPLTESIGHLGKDVSKQMWKNIFGDGSNRISKSKMKEWEEFGKQYPFSWIQEFKDSWLYLFCFMVQEKWNEKPIKGNL